MGVWGRREVEGVNRRRGGKGNYAWYVKQNKEKIIKNCFYKKKDTYNSYIFLIYIFILIYIPT